MEEKNNTVVILLIVLIGAISGVGLLMGVNNAVRVSLSPMNEKITEIERSVKNIEGKLNNGGLGGPDLQVQLQALQNKLNALNTNPSMAQGQPQQPPPEDMDKVYSINPGVSSILGKKDAPVTIVEFSDFQCPFCARYYPAIKDVLNAYPDKVKVIIKNFPLPFHPNARPAAKLAMAANEQGKFQGMMELLLNNSGDVSDNKIKEYAKTLSLDYNKLMDDYKNKDAQWEKQITEDMALGGNADVRGTPTFYLNGKKTNARDLTTFKEAIDKL